MLSTIWKFIWLGLKILIGFSILTTCIFCYAFTVVVVGLSNNSGYQEGVKSSADTTLAPVTFGNPYLPYRDITPQIFTTSKWHVKGTEVDYATPAGTPLYAPEICPCVITTKSVDSYGNTSAIKDGSSLTPEPLGLRGVEPFIVKATSAATAYTTITN